MRILHTSDWHLGHTLQGLPRDHEHAAFLGWLRQVLRQRDIDVLLVSGDVFHTANPAAQATSTWYGFLSQVVRDNHALQVVVIAGNHDSPARLQAPHPILSPMRVQVVGHVRNAADELDMDRLVIPLEDRTGAVRAVCAAVPFLRPEELGTGLDVASDQDRLVQGVRDIYTRVLAAARERHAGQALPIVALGHCYMTGTALSELSERKVLGGNQHALPADIFPDDVAYVALGHLHLAQAVGGRANVRYSGSPIPLSLAESSYEHQVCVVELPQEPGQKPAIEFLHVPRAVDIMRIPKAGAAPLAWVLQRLAQLPPREEYLDDATRPYLELAVKLDDPEPGLRAQVEEALAGRAPRLVKLSVERPGRELALAEAASVDTLHDLRPEQVFRSLYRKVHEREPSPADCQPHPEPAPELLAAFHELVDSVSQQGGQT
ncbi:MAG: exonuclease SbcCD subunit D C-terminal domain-containing protein [Planctomycetota bacterium]|jgi:exonuclease SbcD